MQELESRIDEIGYYLSEIESLLIDVDFSKIPKGVKRELLSILETERDLLRIDLDDIEAELNYIKGRQEEGRR